MPVSTRAQISNSPLSTNKETQTLLRNPHHGLKEKMKALTIRYEQHQKRAIPPKMHLPPQPETRVVATHHPSVELLDSGRKKNEERTQLGKENQETNVSDRIEVYSCPRKPSCNTTTLNARKMSLGGGVPIKPKRVENVVHTAENVSSRIMVFVRLRPMSKKEREGGARSCVRIVNKSEIYLTGFAVDTDYLRLKRIQGRHFCFDGAFDGSTTQLEVYSATTSELLESVLQGRNGTVFCYGATGAGKTYTMLGTMENPGVMVLAIKDLFLKIKQRCFDGNYSVHLSYLEVYNESVRDLLAPGRPLVLREDKQGTVAAGLTQYRAYSADEVMALLLQGNMNRTTEPTRVNETSSRSHAILQVYVEYRVKESSNIVTRIGKLSLIDLAGSERALATDQRTLRSLEGANINRSLLALSSCINALVEGKKHIPYRNSKLTQLLKDSLGGACSTVMIANISPSHLSFGETQNTLHWADRAKEIKTKTCIKEEVVPTLPESDASQSKLILELEKENSDLRQQLVQQQQKILALQAQALASKKASPSPTSSPLLSPLTAPRKTKRSILSGNCFGTPPDTSTKVRALELEIERLKRDHAVQMKQKDELIKDLMLDRESKKVGVKCKASRATIGGEVLNSNHRVTSPMNTTKKRSFWDIGGGGTGSSPLINRRKTRSHVAPKTPPNAPSMLLQPGFAHSRRTSDFSRF